MAFQKRSLLAFVCLSLPFVSSFELEPSSEALTHVDPLIGTAGPDPNLSGGMVPSTSTPFGMTRWVAQRSVQVVSRTAYGISGSALATRAEENTEEDEDMIAGFTATRQPAIWMGENAPFSVTPSVGLGDVQSSPQAGAQLVRETVVDFNKRKLKIVKGDDGKKKETATVGYYSVELEDGQGQDGRVLVEQTASQFNILL